MATSRSKAKPAAAFPTALTPRPTLALPPDHADDKARHPYEPKPETAVTATQPAAAPQKRQKAAKPAGEEDKVPWATRLPRERTRQVKAYCALHGVTIEQAADAALRLLMENHPEGLPE